jgi:hypothetical protein
MNPVARIRAGRLVLCDHVPRKEGLPPAEISLRATPLIQHTMELTRYPVEAVELLVALRAAVPPKRHIDFEVVVFLVRRLDRHLGRTGTAWTRRWNRGFLRG